MRKFVALPDRGWACSLGAHWRRRRELTFAGSTRSPARTQQGQRAGCLQVLENKPFSSAKQVTQVLVCTPCNGPGRCCTCKHIRASCIAVGSLWRALSLHTAVLAEQQTALMSFGSQTGTYTGAWSMMMTHGVAVRFRFVVISSTNLHRARGSTTNPMLMVVDGKPCVTKARAIIPHGRRTTCTAAC